MLPHERDLASDHHISCSTSMGEERGEPCILYFMFCALYSVFLYFVISSFGESKKFTCFCGRRLSFIVCSDVQLNLVLLKG